MLKKMTFKKICLTSLLLLIATILYSYPEELNNHIETYQNKQCQNIYLIDENKYVAMSSIPTDSTTTNEQIEEIIKALTIDSNTKLPQNLNPILPKNTKLLDYDLQDDLLKLNFNKEILQINKEDEEIMIESLTYSLTEIKGINKIKIFIEDKELTELPQTHIKLNNYLDRSYGINKTYNITKINNTKMTTTYYLSNKNDYYIPISKITNDSSNKIDIIIKELKTTPFNNSNLSSKLNNQIELMNYEILNDTINMNFNSILLDNIYEGKLEEEVKYAISYSIHDTLGINEFVFQVNSNDIEHFRLAN